MKTINDLTQLEFTGLLDEYFAPVSQRTKMTEAEIRDLAIRLNEKINVPLIKETKEEKILIKIVIKVDRFLYDNLPNELYDLVRSVDDGIDDDEAKRLIKSLSKLANRYINIPYIPERYEYIAIRFVISIIINAARKLWNLDSAKEKALTLNIPDSENLNEQELESIIMVAA